MNNLFLICPDCYIEKAIREKYGTNSFFLTALGSVFDIDTFEYAEALNQLIESEEVWAIYIVNDFSCSFIQNSLTGEKNYDTNAEKVLKSLINSNEKDISSLIEIKEKAKKVAKLNIYRQAYELVDVAFIGNKIQEGLIHSYGLIYDRVTNEFEKFRIEY